MHSFGCLNPENPSKYAHVSCTPQSLLLRSASDPALDMSDHLPSYAEAKQIMSIILHGH